MGNLWLRWHEGDLLGGDKMFKFVSAVNVCSVFQRQFGAALLQISISVSIATELKTSRKKKEHQVLGLKRMQEKAFQHLKRFDISERIRSGELLGRLWIWMPSEAV